MAKSARWQPDRGLGKNAELHSYEFGHGGSNKLASDNAYLAAVPSPALAARLESVAERGVLRVPSSARQVMTHRAREDDLHRYLRRFHMTPSVSNLQIPIEPELEFKRSRDNSEVFVLGRLALSAIHWVPERVLQPPLAHPDETISLLLMQAPLSTKSGEDSSGLSSELSVLREAIASEYDKDPRSLYVHSLDVHS